MEVKYFYDKQLLCYTDLADFTNFQGIGNDPLYKRYDSVNAVLSSCISEEYRSFLSQPVYKEETDGVEWYVSKWKNTPICLKSLPVSEKEKYQRIFNDTLNAYKSAIPKLKSNDAIILSDALKFVSDDRIYCYDDKVVMVAWGMEVDGYKHTEIGSALAGLPSIQMVNVHFNVGEHGNISLGDDHVSVIKGCTITSELFPTVAAQDGYAFVGWTPPKGEYVANTDLIFEAVYQKNEVVPQPENLFNVHFQAGEHGTIEGTNDYWLPQGSGIMPQMIPSVKAKRKYKFVGWNVEPKDCIVNSNLVFTAEYKKKSWCTRWWFWLMLLLLLLLIAFLLWYFLHTSSKSKIDGPVPVPVVDTTTVVDTSHVRYGENEDIELSTGEVEITLNWHDGNDLDLSCVEPNGNKIWFKDKESRSGGCLEVDMNARSIDRVNPVEHIFWPNNDAPKGTYHVRVNFYNRHDDCPKSSSYTVRVKYGNKVENYSGTLTGEGSVNKVCSFTLE